MKKRYIALIAILGVLLHASVFYFIGWMFSQQYNLKGVSHFLIIYADENQPKTYIGRLDDHDVYIERLVEDGTYFRTINADKDLSLKEAFAGNLVSIAEWRKYAWETETDGETEILKYENYEIAVTRDTCIIRPLIR